MINKYIVVDQNFIKVRVINDFDETFLEAYLRKEAFPIIESILDYINYQIFLRENKSYLKKKEVEHIIEKSSLLKKFFEEYSTFSEWDSFSILKVADNEFYEN